MFIKYLTKGLDTIKAVIKDNIYIEKSREINSKEIDETKTYMETIRIFNSS